MTDVYIVTFSIIGILLTGPGLAIGLNLLAPRITDRAYRRLTETPGASFIFGGVLGAVITTWVVILASVGGAAQGIAYGSAVLGLGIYALGAAGMSRLFGERLAPATPKASPLGRMVRGAVVLELAALTPLVGWFLFVPLAGVMCIGAGAFGLIGWVPKARPVADPVVPDATGD
jgi:hypothetical protein